MTELNGDVLEQLNASIREAAERFVEAGDDLPVEFLCECGCGRRLSLTLREYDLRDGAWIEGHPPHV